jgi:hypothetical protein
MCDAQVAIIVFGPSDELSQFSSAPMEDTLREYGKQCTKSHEMQTLASVQKRAAENPTRGGKGGAKRSRLAAVSGPVEAAQAMLGLDSDEAARDSDTGMEAIDKEFEKILQERAKRAEQAQQQVGGKQNSGAAQPSRDQTTAEGPSYHNNNNNYNAEPPKAEAANALTSLAAALAGAPSPTVAKARPTTNAAAVAANGNTDAMDCSSPENLRPIAGAATAIHTPSVPTAHPVPASADAVPLLGISNSLDAVKSDEDAEGAAKTE